MYGIFLDTETTGLNPLKHRILEIGLKVLDVETGEPQATYEAIVAQPLHFWKQSDPNSLTVNGFTWDMVQSGKSSERVGQEIIDLFSDLNIKRGSAVFICQNPSFDRAFFSQLIDPDLQESKGWPYHWLDLASMYWAIELNKEVFPWTTGVSKDKISKAYHIPPEEKPHKAINGVEHLIKCYEAIVGYPLAVH